MIKFANNVHQTVVDEPFYSEGAPVLIDGVDILDTLCPVSKKTGLRENPLSIIRKLITDPAKQALVGQFLQEIPVDSSQKNLTDEQRFELCVQRLNVGTPAEDDSVRSSLFDIFDTYDSTVKAALKAQSNMISFDPEDAPAKDE